MDQTQPETEHELGQALQYLRMRTQAKREQAQARSRQAHLRARNQEEVKHLNFDQLTDAQKLSIWHDGVERIEASRVLQPRRGSRTCQGDPQANVWQDKHQGARGAGGAPTQSSKNAAVIKFARITKLIKAEEVDVEEEVLATPLKPSVLSLKPQQNVFRTVE